MRQKLIGKWRVRQSKNAAGEVTLHNGEPAYKINESGSVDYAYKKNGSWQTSFSKFNVVDRYATTILSGGPLPLIVKEVSYYEMTLAEGSGVPVNTYYLERVLK